MITERLIQLVCFSGNACWIKKKKIKEIIFGKKVAKVLSKDAVAHQIRNLIAIVKTEITSDLQNYIALKMD